jgi:hypothetical protein
MGNKNDLLGTASIPGLLARYTGATLIALVVSVRVLRKLKLIPKEMV